MDHDPEGAPPGELPPESLQNDNQSEPRADAAPIQPPASDTEATSEAASDSGASPMDAAPEPAPAPETDESQPHLRIEIDVVDGDLMLRGGASHVLLHSSNKRTPDEKIEDRGGVLRFSRLEGDTELAVPDGSEVLVRRIGGDLDAAHLDALLLVQRVDGDAELDGVAICDLVHAGGDLEAYGGGSLRVQSVDGDVEIRDYAEQPVVGHIGGDLEASDLPGLGVRGSVGGDVSLEHCGEVLLIGTIGGDLRAEGSVVTVRASSVGGDVRISSVRGATLAAIGGDLHVESASEGLEVSSVGGDVTIRGAGAAVRLSTIGGDLSVEDAPGGVIARRIGGDADLDTTLGAGAEYIIRAGGDIDLRVRGEVNARFVAQTSGGEIRTKLPLTVERGRRRNLVGVIGRGDATVTLHSDGDISIAATDRFEEEHSMGDDFGGRRAPEGERDDSDERVWEGGLGRHRFRVRWDRGPGRAGVHFQGPFAEDEDPDAMGQSPRDFHVGWEKGQGAHMSGEYEERLNDLRDKAERVARRAAEQAQDYAERATRRARETDWESIGRDVRTTIERAMEDLEDTFNQFRRDWDTRRGSARPPTGDRPSGAQRVRIQYDDEPDAPGAAASSAAPRGDLEAQRRAILEDLRNGSLTLEEAERRLSDLR
ncbi:MAG TPA: DUF4097 family beta strand repeat-containing protein [Ktedonobacterales bacterium]|nr:DUF4097 family beta strand repeat-containing protein [Ktedonobacterales bacterium]